MRGWFDSFRNDGGPTLYSYSNRTPVTGDVPTISLYVLFFTLFTAFIIIFPGIRKERFTTFTVTTLSLFVGSAILGHDLLYQITLIFKTNQQWIGPLASSVTWKKTMMLLVTVLIIISLPHFLTRSFKLFIILLPIMEVPMWGCGWHVADTSIMSYYRAFSREKLAADIGVHIGLMHFNVTLQGLGPPKNYSLVNDGLQEDIDYNERFHWESATEIQEEFREALVKGLPYPILTVVEYFSMDEEGFCWGRSYRQAGYYGSILLWASFASWCLMNLLLIVVPRYGAYQMILTGGLMILTNAIYFMLVPSKRLMIRFEDNFLVFKFGWCFWLVLTAGVMCLIVGSVIAIVDLLYPHKFSTILEVDYGTPFDRHIIIEESDYTKKNKRSSGKRSLENPDEPMGLGRKILRTLSMRGGGDKPEDLDLKSNTGVLNHAYAYEFDPPKSPWRYPQYMLQRPDGAALRPALQNGASFAKNPALARLAAPTPTKSPKSVSFRRTSRLTETFQVDPMRLRRSESQDSAGSSASSSGIVVDHRNELQKLQSQVRSMERQNSASSVSSYGLGLLSRTHSNSKGEISNNHHIAQLSGSIMIPIDPSHLPLSRIVYKQRQIGLLPRASLDKDRKNSSDEENLSNPGNRRDSNNSNKSRSGSNGMFTGFDFKSHKRPGPDGHEVVEDRRGSNESAGSISNNKMALREPDW